MKNKNSVTGQYLAGIKKIPIPTERRGGNGKFLNVIGANEHNLKILPWNFHSELLFVLPAFRSGKSTLINDILVRKVAKRTLWEQCQSGKHEKIEGLGHLDKIINIDQSPIGPNSAQ